MSVELPKDHEGREVPLDTKVLYGADGCPVEVELYKFSPWSRVWFLSVCIAGKCQEEYVDSYYLTPPDTWEKLEEDLGRAAKYGAVVASCRYFTADRCADCRMHNGFTCGTRKTERAFGDVLERIRKLRGED